MTLKVTENKYGQLS